MKSLRIVLAAVLATVFSLGAPVSEAEAGGWAKHHPWRHQVNHRLARQNHRINEKLEHKQMTYQEGSRLKRRDAHIRHEEGRMASAHHGHLTPREHRKLNRQEDRVSRQIGN